MYNILPGVVVNAIRYVVTNDTVGLKLDTSPVATVYGKNTLL